jgi:hypothetical protein
LALDNEAEADAAAEAEADDADDDEHDDEHDDECSVVSLVPADKDDDTNILSQGRLIK